MGVDMVFDFCDGVGSVAACRLETGHAFRAFRAVGRVVDGGRDGGHFRAEFGPRRGDDLLGGVVHGASCDHGRHCVGVAAAVLFGG